MAVVRQLVLMIDPSPLENGVRLCNSLSFDKWVEDGNSDSKAITCAYVPDTKGQYISVGQESLFLGMTEEAGATIQTLRNDLTVDDGEGIQTAALTNRIDPTMLEAGLSGVKRFQSVEFVGVNPYDFDQTVSTYNEVLEPHLDGGTLKPLYRNSGQSRAEIPNGVAGWVHFYISGTPMTNRTVFNGFVLNYYDLEGRDRQGN